MTKCPRPALWRGLFGMVDGCRVSAPLQSDMLDLTACTPRPSFKIVPPWHFSDWDSALMVQMIGMFLELVVRELVRKGDCELGWVIRCPS